MEAKAPGILGQLKPCDMASKAAPLGPLGHGLADLGFGRGRKSRSLASASATF